MNLKMQVTNLEISKKLKEIGLNQESLFVWLEFPKDNYVIYRSQDTNCALCSAFTASELLDILPHIVDTKKNEPFNNFRLWMTKSFIVEGMCLPKKFIYIVNYRCDTTECAGENAWLPRQLISNIHDSNLANALGLMLIYLHENNLL